LPDRRLRLVFFGTPEVAATHLRALVEADEDDVRLVVSQPDRPRGRGRIVEPTPTKKAAEAADLEVVQPAKLKDGRLAARLAGEGLDLAIVVAYGRILPRDLFEAPRFGTWNVHASLLPRHRGAAPIQHAILAGDRETGVTLMQLGEGMDEGDVLFSKTTPIGDEETSGELFARIGRLGAEALVEGLRIAKSEGLVRRPQDPDGVTTAPLLDKADGELDLQQPAGVLARRVRGLAPWPGAYVPTAAGPLKVHRARPVAVPSPAPPGTVAEAGPRFVLATGDGGLELLEVQAPGKRALAAAEFLRGAGRRLEVGSTLAD